jgi:DNA-binding transcriptional regulator YhcF (GntR family)
MKTRPTYITKSGKRKEVNLYYEIRDLRVVDGFELGMKHKVILLVLETHGQEKFPARNMLAKECCCAISTVDSAIKDLESIGLITKVRRRNKFNPKQFTSNLYTINTDKVCEAVENQREIENNKFIEIDSIEVAKIC